MTIESLPLPILSIVFSYLHIRDLGKLGEVCKKWKEISKSDELWKPFYSRLFSAQEFPQTAMHLCVTGRITLNLFCLKRRSEIPKNLPAYETEYVASEFSRSETWVRYGKYHSMVQINGDPKLQLGNVLGLVSKVFETFIILSQIEFTTLEQAEAFARETKGTFQNPYPFATLASEYAKRGNHAKAKEMEEIAVNINIYGRAWV